MQYAVVILDGAAGYPLECFDGKTSLEAAVTPNLDALAAAGICGLSKNVPDGMEPSSNTACTSIIGYDPLEYPIGRGAIEGASFGLELEPGQVAFRFNLTNVRDGVMNSYSTGNITTEDGNALIRELKVLDDDTFTIYPGVAFRGILVVDGGHDELMDVSYTAPHNITDTPIAGTEPKGPGAELIIDYQRRADEVLATSPLNARRVAEGLLPATNSWVFWPGMKPEGMRSFADVYGKSVAMSSPVDLLNGLAALTGMDRCTCPGLTDGEDNDFAAQGELALRMLEDHDVIFVHVEAPDTMGHDGEPLLKKRVIEDIDREIIGRLRAYAQEHELRILALPDHPTPVALKTHSREAVPFVMAGPGIGSSAGARLTENEAAKSGIVYDPGCGLLATLLG